jgi:uncharacterized protein
MVKVYFKRIDSYEKTDEINKAVLDLLKKLIHDDKIVLEKKIALKVHFGEKGNMTFIEPKNFESLTNYLKENNVDTSYIETNVLYKGARMTKDDHTALAKEHGFTQLPIIIADGEHGEDYDEIGIDGKHFKTCKIGKKFSDYKQLIVVSHFKGHMLAGYGGAIKQLSMGCASRGGKLAMHANSFPLMNPLKCKKCMVCTKHCPTDALSIGTIPYIKKDKCIGCATCIAVCPHNAIMINWASTMPGTFKEKLAEYALAAQKGKHNIYLSFALNITGECDCMGTKMKIVAKDIGVFISTDAVAIDAACMDALDKSEGKKVFGGRSCIEYGASIGLGRMDYELEEI